MDYNALPTFPVLIAKDHHEQAKTQCNRDKCREAHYTQDMSNKAKCCYQKSLGGPGSAAFLTPSLAVFLGNGAKPPKNPQNSPAPASAINFPSSGNRIHSGFQKETKLET